MAFTRMDRSTRADWDRIAHASVDAWALVPDRILAMLRSLADITTGFAVDQLQHSLQTATRAERAGADDEVVVAALCHDVGKAISEPNHPAVAAALLRPYVREEVAWMIEVHQDFQGRYYYKHLGKDPAARDRYRSHVAYVLAEQFADDWDQASFDPDYDTLPLDHFEPLIRRTFAAPQRI
ncbi:MAG: HD domain-containing protein [Acidimicrobiales bacterium]